MGKDMGKTSTPEKCESGQRYPRKVCIQGTWYTVEEASPGDDPALAGAGGYCDVTARRCVIDRMDGGSSPKDFRDLESVKKRILRHELIHAFLYESGLDQCSWADNEEMIDFFAISLPKIFHVFCQAKALEMYRPGEPEE